MPNTRKNPRDPDSPFVTAEGMAKAIPFKQLFPKMDTTSIKVIADPPVRRRAPSPPQKQVTVRLSQDVVKELRATGPGWDRLADDLLRAALKRRRATTKTTRA